MNKRQIKKALEQNSYRTFAGAKIDLQKGQLFLLDDIVSLLNKLESDRKKFTSDQIGEPTGVLKIDQDGIKINWVLVAGDQGNILMEQGTNIEAGILHELEEKLHCATKEAVSALDDGNALALEATQTILTADQVHHHLQSSPNSRIARNVAVRAAGPQTTFAFPEGERNLGGNLPVPKEFTNTELLQIAKCKVVRWLNNQELMLQAVSLPDNPLLIPFFKKKVVQVRVQRNTIESAVLNCAALADAIIDIEVSIGLILKSGRKPLQLVSIHNPSSVFDAAQTRLDELRNSL